MPKKQDKKMKPRKVYYQPYSRKRFTASAYGRMEGDFFGDIIHLWLPDNKKEYISMTPNEAADIIRALSAALHHYLSDNKATPVTKIVKRLEKYGEKTSKKK